MRISKSKFCAGVQCPKRLYLQVHSPELAEQPDAAAEAIIEQGHEVGMLARQLFPGGVEVCERSLDQAIRATRELVADPEIPAIFEGVFEHGGVLVKIDVLHRRRAGDFVLLRSSRAPMSKNNTCTMSESSTGSCHVRGWTWGLRLLRTLIGIMFSTAKISTYDDFSAYAT